MITSTNSHKETLVFGESLGRFLQSGDIVLLFGDLGAGKTTLTQGICRGLGIAKSKYIRSPSFTLVNEYLGTYPIYHIDLYRLDSFSEIESLGLEECLFSSGVSIIEWAEKLSQKSDCPGLGINERIEIKITIEKENCRTFRIEMINQNDRSLPIKFL